MTPTLEGTAPLKGKRKNVDKDREREKEALALRSNAGSVPPSKKSKPANQDTTPVSYNPRHIVAGPSSEGLPLQAQPSHVAMPSDDSSFFDHVKRALDSRDFYHEFLKLVNLFTQEYVNTATLVKESRNFLRDTELHKQLRRYIFFTNTAFYVLIRLLQLLVARLSVFKDFSAQIALESPKSQRSNPVFGIQHAYKICIVFMKRSLI
ncbi:hypothetical protein H1R20_g15436, partial [Candolleomyces eurysporus]